VPILNYSTRIAVGQTIGEIQAKLWKRRARAIQIEAEDGEPIALRFVIDTPFGPRPFALPANIEGVRAALAREMGVQTKIASRAHAAQVAWRIVKDWLDVQFALIDAGQASLEQVMLPYLVVDRDGHTLYEAMVERRLALPASGREVKDG
jgi:hypothetical protein